MSQLVPSTATALAAIVRLTIARVRRGKLMIIGGAIGLLPIVLAALLPSNLDIARTVYVVELLVLAIVPAMFVASSVGEELEDRTAAYLWSRPITKWVILTGKLVALAPFSAIVVGASFTIAIRVGTGAFPPASTIVAICAGTVAVAAIAAGIATLVPGHGLSLTIVYVLFVDSSLGAIPGAIRNVSITHAVGAIAGRATDTPAVTGAIALVVIAGLWIAVAFRRIGRLEA